MACDRQAEGSLAMTFSAVTTVIAPAASFDLTDLTTAKDELAIGGNNTADDSWLRRAITQVSRAVMAYTKRTFSPEFVSDAFSVDPRTSTSRALGSSILQLTRWPLIDVVSVIQTQPSGLTQTLAEGAGFTVNPATGELTRIDASTGMALIWEALPVTVRYVAGYGAAAVETHVVPGVSPYEVTVSQSAVFSCDQAVAYPNGTLLTLVSSAPTAGQYAVSAGAYTFNAADAGKSLSFTYATKAVPDDLVEIALRLITARYRAKGRDPSLVQRETPGVGMERWWFGAVPGQTGPFSPDIEGALEFYCMPVLV
jgi:hypothetical protein